MDLEKKRQFCSFCNVPRDAENFSHTCSHKSSEKRGHDEVFPKTHLTGNSSSFAMFCSFSGTWKIWGASH